MCEGFPYGGRASEGQVSVVTVEQSRHRIIWFARTGAVLLLTAARLLPSVERAVLAEIIASQQAVAMQI